MFFIWLHKNCMQKMSNFGQHIYCVQIFFVTELSCLIVFFGLGPNFVRTILSRRPVFVDLHIYRISTIVNIATIKATAC